MVESQCYIYSPLASSSPVHYSSVLPLPPFHSVLKKEQGYDLAMYTSTYEINKIKGKHKHFSFPKNTIILFRGRKGAISGLKDRDYPPKTDKFEKHHINSSRLYVFSQEEVRPDLNFGPK